MSPSEKSESDTPDFSFLSQESAEADADAESPELPELPTTSDAAEADFSKLGDVGDGQPDFSKYGNTEDSPSGHEPSIPTIEAADPAAADQLESFPAQKDSADSSAVSDPAAAETSTKDEFAENTFESLTPPGEPPMAGDAVDVPDGPANAPVGPVTSAQDIPPTEAASRPATRKLKRKKTSAVPPGGTAPAAASAAEPSTFRDNAPRSRRQPGRSAGNDQVTDDSIADAGTGAGDDEPTVPKKSFVMVAGYAAALTLLLLLFWLTGRLQLAGPHPLESLPDIKPLQPGEFQKIPENAQLPQLHDLQLGQTRRFGNVELTPLRVTRGVLTTVNPARRNSPPETQTAGPVLKLWFKVKNVSQQTTFAPWDLGLMCLRSPEFSIDESAMANSWLKADPGTDTSQRILNYMHPPGSLIQLTDQNSGRRLEPGEEAEFYVACAEDVQHLKLDAVDQFVWRIQIRKGVSEEGNGVTTMVDFMFDPDQIEDADTQPSAA